jgi:DNA-binding NtrC family response regulator
VILRNIVGKIQQIAEKFYMTSVLSSEKSAKKLKHILICDDDPLIQLHLKSLLKSTHNNLSSSRHYQAQTCYHTDEAKVLLKKNQIDLLILDIQMRTHDEGLDFLPFLKSHYPQLPVITLSGRSDFQTLKKAFHLGVRDFLSKDCSSEEILSAIEKIFYTQDLEHHNLQLKNELTTERSRYQLVGNGSSMIHLKNIITKFREAKGNILITGETGTGKEVVARNLRKQFSNGDLEPFIAVDSGSILQSTAESALFGYEKGAFTGADQQKIGYFEAAHGGILYFDEIANMPLTIQTKLLRVIQEKEILRLGSTTPVTLDFRVVCATNRNLEEQVKKGEFLSDLYQRLAVLPIDIPPLRERTEDISELLEHFLKKEFYRSGKQFQLDSDLLLTLKKYHWPGNIRELQNTLDYAIALTNDETITFTCLPAKIRNFCQPAETEASTFYEKVEAFEKQLLQDELKKSNGNRSQLAKKLGMDRSHLYQKIKCYDIK